ncbi:phosphatidyl serine synthase, partial [Cystoisospora suis]
MEISLRHILPNFWECWWDHLILDIFGCNFLGLYLGLCLCRYFQMKEYCWHKCGESMAPLENDGDTLQEEEEYFNCGFSSSSSSSSRKLKNVDENKEVTFSQEIEKDEEDGSSSSFSDKGMRSSTTPSKGDTEREREEEDHEEERRLGQRSCCRSPSDRLASSPSHRHEGCQGGHVSRKFFHLLMPSHLQQFTPYEWTGYKWPQFFSSAPTFLSLLVFCVAVTLVDLNVFFLKAELWIEPSHWLILLRLTLWTFMAAAGTREYYDFLTD